MKRIITTFFSILILAVIILANTSSVYGYEPEAGSSARLKTKRVLITKPDAKKKALLSKYLAQFDSPLPAETFIAVAEEYELDWRLLPAISGVESTFGKRIPHNSNNPFGWNGGNYQFLSWDEAIKTVGKSLREKYMDRWGATTVEEIWPIYAPPSKTWGKNVLFFMNKMQEFEAKSSMLDLNFSI